MLQRLASGRSALLREAKHTLTTQQSALLSRSCLGVAVGQKIGAGAALDRFFSSQTAGATATLGEKRRLLGSGSSAGLVGNRTFASSSKSVLGEKHASTSSGPTAPSGASSVLAEDLNNHALLASAASPEASLAASTNSTSTSESTSTATSSLRQAGATLTNTVAKKGLIFEFSMMWVVTAWKEILVGVIRNTAYTFRPVALFFVMGYVVKFLFFLMGAPMLVSFYSVWLFEVGYNLAQCFLSVIFLTQLTYMDLSFRGTMRPLMRLQAKRVKDVAKKAAKMLRF
ncbi:unnamed protein product [Amoebophrya sp. A25]|nr:unnamed protein product [Amoebophrya sp. A25]|eukprot:GSA25T00013019001.1